MRFTDRQVLSLEEIYDKFFSAQNLSKASFYELWTEVSSVLRIPPGKLRPDDRFDQELAAPQGWEHGDEIIEVQWIAERRLKRGQLKAELSQIKTLRNYVEFFCKLENQIQRA